MITDYSPAQIRAAVTQIRSKVLPVELFNPVRKLCSVICARNKSSGFAVEPIRSINMVRDTREEKIAIIQKENRYGVVSNQGRIVIPPTYSDIINVGSSEAPLYFTERNIPEASLYIVIYYDRTGEMLRKEIYDDSAVYDKIYCSDP